MILLRDDPIISCIMRTGYPPWMLYADAEDIIDADYEEINDEYDEEEEEDDDE